MMGPIATRVAEIKGLRAAAETSLAAIQSEITGLKPLAPGVATKRRELRAGASDRVAEIEDYDLAIAGLRPALMIESRQATYEAALARWQAAYGEAESLGPLTDEIGAIVQLLAEAVQKAAATERSVRSAVGLFGGSSGHLVDSVIGQLILLGIFPRGMCPDRYSSGTTFISDIEPPAAWARLVLRAVQDRAPASPAQEQHALDQQAEWAKADAEMAAMPHDAWAAAVRAGTPAAPLVTTTAPLGAMPDAAEPTYSPIWQQAEPEGQVAMALGGED